MPVSVSDGGLTVRVGEGAVTVRVTGIETGVVLEALTVIKALYVPAVSELVEATAVIEPLPVPEVEEMFNQEALSLTVHVLFELMAMVWAEGFAAPCVAV
jgi:hypothetical protein